MKIRAKKSDLIKAIKEEISKIREDNYEYPSEELVQKWADWLGFPKEKVKDLMLNPHHGITIKDVMRRLISGKEPKSDMEELLHGKYRKANVKMESRIIEDISDDDARKIFNQPGGKELLASVVNLLKSGDKNKISNAIKTLSQEKPGSENMNEEKIKKTGRVDLTDTGAIPIRQIAASVGLSAGTVQTIINKTMQKIVYLMVSEKDLWKEIFKRDYPPPTRQEIENLINENAELRRHLADFVSSIYMNEFSEYSDALTVLNREIIAIEDDIEASPEDMSGYSDAKIEAENMRLASDLKKLKIKTKQWQQLASEFVRSVDDFNMKKYAKDLKNIFQMEDYRLSLETEMDKPLI